MRDGDPFDADSGQMLLPVTQIEVARVTFDQVRPVALLLVGAMGYDRYPHRFVLTVDEARSLADRLQGLLDEIQRSDVGTQP